MDIYETRNGRFLLATWDERQAQFRTTHIRPDVREAQTGYCYTFARTVEGIAPYAILYPTLALARQALKLLEDDDGEDKTSSDEQ